ncbi:MAG TPA: hypothetical protein VGP88_06940 [Thermoplasmata archaeon]|jgi:hypothetical protein|nr:hypothetical protein [Thermoplasmata archaeon]
MSFGRIRGIRLLRGVGAFVLADLITGLAAFSVIVSAALWYFCFSWIRLVGEYRHIGVSFGSSTQLTLAWVGLFACLAPLGASLVLAWDAYRLPRALLH